MNPWLLLAAVLALFGSFFSGQWKGARDCGARWEARLQRDRADAEAAARSQEAMWQGVVNGTVRNYEFKVAGLRRDLGSALDGLRSRPERPAGGMPADPRTACAGASGAELSRADAEFLVREAARADGIRAGLAACYEVIDALKEVPLGGGVRR